MGIRTNTLLLSLALSCPLLTSAQVTIGSTEAPAEGAILDLKEEGTTKRGLALPRVNLKTRTSLEPCISGDLLNDPDQALLHIGLVVYNVNEVDAMTKSKITKDEMLCRGLHVWDGNQWEPLFKYYDPDITKSGRREDITITRGPGGVETTTYTTAYFHGYSRKDRNGNPTSGSVYVCDPNNLVEIDAGQWMTMNMRTKYLPNRTTEIVRQIGNIGDNHVRAQYIEPKNPASLSAADVERNGLFYNWSAATNERDPDRALGVVDPKNDYGSLNPHIQGICPDGWHLPDMKEFEQLKLLHQAQYYLLSDVPYNHEGLNVTAAIAAAMTSTFEGKGKSHSPEQGGIDWRRIGAIWGNWNTQSPKSEYGLAGFYWSANYGETDTRNEIDKNKWNTRGYRASTGYYKLLSERNEESIQTGSFSFASRVILQSVRCKKD